METPSGGIDAGALRALRGSRGSLSRSSSSDPARPSSDPGAPLSSSTLLGTSRAMSAVRARIELVAAARRTTLVVGPTGSGKEVVARALHEASSRATQPFVSVHCAALPESLVEAELFGHARGAFTGAVDHRAGLVRTASAGTLFLDEIDSLSLGTQAKLLRFLELGEYRPVGSDKVERSAAWVIAATNQDLHARVERGQFRADLLYRLDVVRLDVPSLLERGADEMVALAEHFVRRVQRTRGIELWLDPSARAAIASHDWPGNVRELKNRVESAALLGGAGRIDAARLGLPATRRSSAPPPREPVLTAPGYATTPPPPALVRDEAALGPMGAAPAAPMSMPVDPEPSRASERIPTAPDEASLGEGILLDKMLWELVAARGLSLSEAVSACERSIIRTALQAARDNRVRAASLLRIHVRTLYKKLDGAE